MQYEVLVLGATFAASGMMKVLGNHGMILERRPQAGYEFLGAMRAGLFPEEPVSREAKSLFAEFQEEGVYGGQNPCLFPAASAFYKTLQGKNVMLNCTPVLVERAEDGFKVTAHGVSGFREYRARRVMDTRVRPWQVEGKSLKILVSRTAESLPTEVDAIPYGPDGDLLVTCHMEKEDDWTAARTRVAKLLATLPKGTRLLYTADEWDYTLKEAYDLPEDRITYLPSAGFADPVAAFDAGVRLARGEENI